MEHLPGGRRHKTPAEHYAEAERLLALYEDNSSPAHQDWAAMWGSQTLAAAQVHATLATATPPPPSVPVAADAAGDEAGEV